MATLTTTIPGYRAGLILMLQARAGLAAVHICDGPPPPGVLQTASYIALMKTKGRQAVRAMGRNQPREERYIQEIELSVVGQTRSDQVTIGAAAFALLAELEDAIRTNPTMAGFYVAGGGGSIYSQILGAEEYQPFADDTQRESRITVGLDVHARL